MNINYAGGTFNIQSFIRDIRNGLIIYFLAWIISLIILYSVVDPPIRYSFWSAIAFILLIVGGWYFSLIFGLSVYVKRRANESKISVWLMMIFLLSISIFIFGIILYISILRGQLPKIFDIATLWSAVYGTICGTYGLLKTS